MSMYPVRNPSERVGIPDHSKLLAIGSWLYSMNKKDMVAVMRWAEALENDQVAGLNGLEGNGKRIVFMRQCGHAGVFRRAEARKDFSYDSCRMRKVERGRE